MGRKTQDNRLESIYNSVTQNPGERPGFLARLLGLHRSEITRSLPALEDRGLYLYEDEKGGLWPFNRKKLN